MMTKLISKIFTYIVLTFIIVSYSFGQDQVIESPLIARMIEVFKQRNFEVENVQVWRIQIKAFTDRRQMEVEKSQFERSFPYYSLEWKHDDPYYILILKNMYFVRKLDAMFVLNQIKYKYPASILTRDNVPPEDLLNSMIF